VVTLKDISKNWGKNIKLDHEEVICEDVDWINLAKGRVLIAN
jgi:hypothetical protein